MKKYRVYDTRKQRYMKEFVAESDHQAKLLVKKLHKGAPEGALRIFRIRTSVASEKGQRKVLKGIAI